MAAIQRSQAKLFHELKQMCPGVPDEVVNTCMQQNGNDKEKCLQVLQNENRFGPRSQSEPWLQNTQQIQDDHRLPVDPSGVTSNPRVPTDPRPQNDGHIDNDLLSHRIQEVHITHEQNAIDTRPSLHSYASQSRDTGTEIQTSISWPSDLMRATDHGRQSPNTAPVMPQDFAPFVQQNISKSPQQIPNINCTTYAGTDSSGNASPRSAGSPSEGRRAVPVYHYPSRSPTTPPFHNQQYVYRIQVGDGGGLCTVSPQPSPMQKVHQPLPQSVNQQSSPELSPGVVSYSSSPAPVTNQYSTQTTFYINKNNGHMSPERQRTSNFPNFSRDPRWGVQHSMTPVPSFVGVHQVPSKYTQPLSVTIRAAGPEGTETKLRYVGSTPDRPGFQILGAHSPTRFGVSALASSQLPGQFPSASHASFHIQPPTPVANSTSPAFVAPSVPPHYHSPAAAPSPTHGIPVGSQCSEHGNLVLQETGMGQQGPLYPTMSPASSQSSLSSESSRSDIQRPRSGSVQDEIAYTQALLSHQHSRMGRLKQDFQIDLQKLDKLQTEVSQMEKNMLEQRSQRRNSFPAVDDITKMRQANRKMQTDIQVMVNEIDMYKNGQTPLGVIDPHGQQNFFKNIPTGQRNSIYSSQPHNDSRSSESPPPIPPRDNLSYVPPAPPTQRTTGSGDSEEGEQWSCSECTLLNHPALNKCECCEMPRVVTGS